jgi:bifunctional non-homologous end joining protein LigD
MAKQSIKSASTVDMPSLIKPMLCTLVKKAFTKEGWLYEVKWDGYRIIAYKNGKAAILRSRVRFRLHG